MAETGKLIGIGVGPGDTELLTLKAARVLKTVPVIFSPKSAKEKESIALSIVKPIIEERSDYKRLMVVEPIFPMIEDLKELERCWNSAAEMIAQYLDSGRDVAFITLGDSSVFSIPGTLTINSPDIPHAFTARSKWHMAIPKSIF